MNEKHLREQGQHYRSYKQQTTDEMEPRISQVDEEVFSVDTSVQCGTGSLSLSDSQHASVLRAQGQWAATRPGILCNSLSPPATTGPHRRRKLKSLLGPSWARGVPSSSLPSSGPSVPLPPPPPQKNPALPSLCAHPLPTLSSCLVSFSVTHLAVCVLLTALTVCRV